MCQRYPHLGVGMLCGLFGKTRNAFYDHQRRATVQALLDGLVLELVARIRHDLPRVGTRKLLHVLRPQLGDYAPRVGRDYLFSLLATHGLLVRRRKRRVITTQTCLPLFRRPNLIECLVVQRAEQVWVSDITYVRLRSGWSYLSLVTDLYSHKIVGACLHPDLSVRGTLTAIQQALAGRRHPQRPLIHHSDRGLQPAAREYAARGTRIRSTRHANTQHAAREYVGLLESQGVALSMTQHGDPYENAVAERVNGILKEEFGLGDTLPSFTQAQALVVRAVRAYNDLRPHSSCDFLTPSQAHTQEGALVRRWKSYYQAVATPVLR